jgi:S1-C subfamily serine protease
MAPPDVHWSWTTVTIHEEYDAAAITIKNGNTISVKIAPSAAPQTAGDPTLLVASSSDGIPALAPIVEQGQSNILPLLGIAQGSAPGKWNRVFPLVLMQADAGGLADQMAGPVAGAVPYAGVDADGSSLLPRPGGPADVSGIRSGDVLISVDGQPMYSIQDLDTVVRRHRPNDTLTVVVDREGRPKTVQLVLGYVPI